MAIDIHPLDAAPAPALDALLDEAFGNDRHGRTAYRLRAGMSPIAQLSFVALDDGALVASLQCWPLALTTPAGDRHPLVLVGPIAVRPSLQRAGLGRRITRHALGAADATAAPPLVLIGDPEYYGRWFGFSADATGGWQVPGPVERRRLLARIAPDLQLPAIGELGPGLCTASPKSLDRAHA